MKARFVIPLNSLLLGIILILSTSATASNKLVVSDLSCENLNNPLGVNTLTPRFSWINTASQNGITQSSYQILVSDEIGKLNEKDAVYWDSKKVKSVQSVLVEYQGKPLSTGKIYYWKVRVWDNKGRKSEWSAPAKFSIGLLEKSDWKASYIGFASEQRFQSCPQFYNQFSIDKIDKNDSYLMHINSLGYHELYINGKKVSDNVLSPAVSQFDKRSLVVTYDITPQLKEGKNDVIIWLGSGWYSEKLPGVIGDGPLVKAQIEKVSKDAKEIVLVTNDLWNARESEYSRISDWWSGRYGGETISGNLGTRNKTFLNPEKTAWGKARIVNVPEHSVSPQMAEADKIVKTITPTTITALGDKTYLVDMGTTLSGWFEITFKNLTENQEIRLDYADYLNNEGQPANQGQTDKYIASGSGTELFKNKFNYHGFRYVKISNISEAPNAASIKAHFIHTDFESISSFTCSDNDLNRIHDMVLYTLQCVGLGGYLVDCPQIERLGYGGDGNASTVTAQTMFNLAPMYRNWLQAWGDVIREDGGMPHTAPNPYSAGGGPYWCGFIISASWNTYLNYGDSRILEQYYPTMLKWLEYVDRYSVDGLLKKWPNTDYRNWYLGDWATPDGVGNPDHIDDRSIDLVSNCYISICLNQMSKIANVLNKKEDKQYFTDKRAALLKKIHETFYDNEKGFYATGSQIDMIYPMLAGATPSQLENKLIETLIQRTESNFNGHIATGLVGIPVMMEWAAKANEPQFIYSMLKKKTYPGYLFMLENGATTTWEHWNGERSRIHNCFNGVGQWFYQSVGGIRSSDDGVAYSKFIIQPQIPEGVTWAKTTLKTAYGLISVHWTISGNSMNMEIDVPVGSSATFIPHKEVPTVSINNKNQSVGSKTISLSSGKHSISYNF